MRDSSITPLVKILQQMKFLEADQLKELQTRFSDAHSLAKELLRRGLLNPFQAERLLTDDIPSLVLGSYVLVQRLGSGGMGDVYKARHIVMDRLVALKVIRKEFVSRADVAQRFQREIRAIAQLDHPNIVRALDAAEINGVHFMAMELLEGITLSRWVKERGAMDRSLACECICQAALGLQHIFESGLVHRDIKPSNLMLLEASKQVKILDLGLVLLRDCPAGEVTCEGVLTTPGGAVGTWGYVAPEQIIDAFTETQFYGYAAQGIPGNWRRPCTDGAGETFTINSTSLTFAYDSTAAVGQDDHVFGYYVTDAANALIWAEELFPNPGKFMDGDDDFVIITPKLALD